MWEAVAVAPLPLYSYKRDKRKQSKTADMMDLSPTSSAPAQPLPPPPPPAQVPANLNPELLEPAIDGPPSPERIRQLSKQMKRGSVFDRNNHQRHHQQPSSGSSSLRSFTSTTDRPTWEQALESVSLSRRSSSRSTRSSMPSSSGDRPDSVQIFGKAIFNRRGKLKRDSKSSSSSSMYSAELPYEGPGPTSNPGTAKDYFIPIVLRRRRATTMKEPVMEKPPTSVPDQKKVLISGPYNFQHVTHARRETVPDLQYPHRSELATEITTVSSTAGEAAQAVQQSDRLHFSNFSSEAINMNNMPPMIPSPVVTPPVEPHTRVSVNRGSITARNQVSSPRRLVKKSQSQEQLRTPPPRPPRSPPPEPTTAPPVPPPRLSSRATMQYNDQDATLDRPSTSGGLRQPQPFSPPFEYPLAIAKTLTTAPGFTHTDHPADEMNEYFDPRFSHALTTPDDAAWPLTSSSTFAFESTLPEVPEEEENYNYTTSRSRISVASNSSSLRASRSVPALRSSVIVTRTQSNASETLGRFDMMAVRKTLTESLPDEGEDFAIIMSPTAGPGSPRGDGKRDRWEDDIDYCYDHEAEADFDYKWDRPSLDLTREDLEIEDDFDASNICSPVIEVLMSPCGERMGSLSSSLLTPSRFDVPELSPASHTSALEREGDEVRTPTATTTIHPSSVTRFSVSGVSRRNGRAPSLPHIRNPSTSSFKESHGFNLSPSLLIPNDYHQQMLLERHEATLYPHDEYPEELLGQREERWEIATPPPGATIAVTAATSPTTAASPVAPVVDMTNSLHPATIRAQLRYSSSSIGSESSGQGSDVSVSGPTGRRHVSGGSTSTSFSTVTSEVVVLPPFDKEFADGASVLMEEEDEEEMEKMMIGEEMEKTEHGSDEVPPIPHRSHSRNRSAPLNAILAKQGQQQPARESIRARRQRSKTMGAMEKSGTATPPEKGRSSPPSFSLFPGAYVVPGGNRT